MTDRENGESDFCKYAARKAKAERGYHNRKRARRSRRIVRYGVRGRQRLNAVQRRIRRRKGARRGG